MSRVLILSKTRMREGRVCVGGIDLDKHCSIRLLDRNGYHETLEDCPYSILDIWDIIYEFSTNRPLPHSREDIVVYSRRKLSHENLDGLMLQQILINAGMPIYEGDILNAYDGCLKSTRENGGSLYISRDNVPNCSTCFYVTNKNLQRDDYGNKIRYKYPTTNWGYTIAYVGVEPNIQNIIQPGRLIRLSLAHWWNGDGSGEERCYLQMSGYF